MLDASWMGAGEEGSRRTPTRPGGEKAGEPADQPHSGRVGGVTVGTDRGGTTGAPEQFGP